MKFYWITVAVRSAFYTTASSIQYYFLNLLLLQNIAFSQWIRKTAAEVKATAHLTRINWNATRATP